MHLREKERLYLKIALKAKHLDARQLGTISGSWSGLWYEWLTYSPDSCELSQTVRVRLAMSKTQQVLSAE